LRAGFSGIVHSMWTDHDLGFLDLLLDRRRHRLVGSFHNCSDTFADTIRFPRRLRRFDAIIIMSERQRRFFLDAGVWPERIHVVLHGVDTGYFTPGTAVLEPFTVLAAGGYRRNFPLLREVCVRLKGEAGIRVEVVGPAAFASSFEDLANVRFRSGLSDREYLETLQSCSCLLQTVENATANNVILEAMACRQPVVAERIGGIPEYVDESCAILTEAGAADRLAAALIELRKSPAKRELLAAGARKRAEALDWENVAAQMRRIYERL
jgi:glycosyltransferase involved in cell wall biosynthesis